MSAAYCESCEARGDLSLEDLMEGNASCEACGGILVLMAEGDEEEDEEQDGGGEEDAQLGPPDPELPDPEFPDPEFGASEARGQTPDDLPPLPSWDGSDTREVEGGERFDELRAAAQALLAPTSAEPIEEELETIELAPGESSSGRASRSYDADQLDQTTKDWGVGADREPRPDSELAQRAARARDSRGRGDAKLGGRA